MVVAFVLALLAALPDALLALWFKLLGEACCEHDRGSHAHGGVRAGRLRRRRPGCSACVSTRMQRRFRDKITIALEAHVARLQASVATIAHQERPDYLDRLAMLRDQVFVLDHMYMSVFSTCGWIVRLGVTIALLMSIHPALVLLALFAAADRDHRRRGGRAVERVAQQRAAPFNRLARHLFTTATTAPPGKEVRVTGIGHRLVTDRREAWDRGFGPVSAVRWRSAGWHTLAWAIFGGAYVGAVVFVSSCLHGVGRQCSARARRRLAPVGVHRRDRWRARVPHAASGWTARDGSPGSKTTPPRSWPAPIVPVPARLVSGIRFDHVSFAYPGTERLVLDDVNLELPAGAVVAIVGENGAGKTHARQAARQVLRADVRPDSRRRRRSGADARRRVARPPGRRVPGLLPLRVHGPAHRRPRRRAAAGRRSRRSLPPSAGPARTTSWCG